MSSYNHLKPYVSVIMSVLNEEAYLEQAIASILNQSLSNLELIIVDDGSTDGTALILSTIRDTRLRILCNKNNIGLTRSLNNALAVVRGPYVARMDANDLSDLDRFEHQMAFMEANKDVALLGTAARRLDHLDRPLSNYQTYSRTNGLKKLIFEKNCFFHPTIMARTSVLHQLGGYRCAFQYAQDYDLWLRISERWEIENLYDYLVTMRILPFGISRSYFSLQQAFDSLARNLAKERRIYGKEISSVELESRRILAHTFTDAKLRSEGYLNYSKVMLSTRQYRESLYFLFRSMLASPVNVNPWFWAANIITEKSRKLLNEFFG